MSFIHLIILPTYKLVKLATIISNDKLKVTL